MSTQSRAGFYIINCPQCGSNSVSVEHLDVTGVISSLLGFTEGVIKAHFFIVRDEAKGLKCIEESGEIQRARALLEKLRGER